MTDSKIKNLRETLNTSIRCNQHKGLQSFLFSVLSIFFGFLLGFIVMLAVNPSQSLKGFSTLIIGGVPNGLQSIGNILFNCTPLIGAGLAVAIASKAGVFNIGGSGQFTFGGCIALMTANLLKDVSMPNAVAFLVVLIAGMLGGALWALVPALLKNHFNVNIVVSAIMMNYIAVYLTGIITKTDMFFDQSHNRFNINGIANCTVPQAGLNVLFSTNGMKSRLDIGIIIAVLVCILLYFVFAKTTFGLRIKTSGQNEFGAKYAGINNKKSLAYAMAISGAMAGMGAVFMYCANPSTASYFQPTASVNAIGFTGISVALIANNNPLAVILSAILISYIQTSGGALTSIGFNANIIGIITSVIIYSAATVFFLSKVVVAFKDKHGAKKKERLLTVGLQTNVPNDFKEVNANE